MVSTGRSCLTSSWAAFAGHREDAGLDLPDGVAADAMLARLVDGSHAAFAEALADVGNCRRPIRLDGESMTVDRATGEVLGRFSSTDTPLGQLYVPCGNRRAHVCPACSRTYARDTFELIRAGVAGGKSVPPMVRAVPLVFVTLTAPSFGYVHGVRPDGGRCRPRRSDTVETCPHGVRLGCSARHEEDDRLVGGPLCPDCYDWTGAVIWQWHVPVLWRRTTTALRRELARRLGTTEGRLKGVASLQFAKVAEYQARGLVHFHALIRLDGPDGPGSPAPLTADDLADAVRAATSSTAVPAPPAWESDLSRVIGWGRQLDVRIVTHGGGLAGSERLEPAQVAGYLAKYATKDSGLSAENRDRPHLHRLADTCRELHEHAVRRAEWRRAGLSTVVPLDSQGSDHYALIGKWAHMLGFRGHFASKSRRYSVTLRALRRARARFRRLVEQSARSGEPLDTRDLERRLLAEDDEATTLVVGSWAYAGTGWPRPGDAVLAVAAAARAREYAQWKAETTRTAAAHPHR